MARICVTLTEPTARAAIARMGELADVADLFELRVDAMESCDLRHMLAARLKPIIVTNRARREGGRAEQDETERLSVLAEAVRLGADYVDVEADALAQLERMIPPTAERRTRIIASYHDTRGMPADLCKRAHQIESSSADVVKVVGTAHRPADNLPVFDCLRQATKPTIALAMGQAGQLSRILAGKFGALLTFASSAAGAEGAPGQITAGEMRRLYRADRVGPQTQVYAVMGNPVEHSLSPAIHNAAFADAGLDAVYVRLKVEGDPADAVRTLAAIPLDGCSVTIPHKQAVMRACGDISPLARRIGAVNTLVRREGGYYATNTDVTAAMKALCRAADTERFDGRTALVVGAGGVGRAFVFGLVDHGARVMVTDIDAERRQSLAAEAGARAIAPEDVPAAEADILMNATPVGMWPKTDVTPIDRRLLREGQLVFDAVYNPQETRLLREAREAGATTVSGIEQFVGQAIEQFELWTGREAPADLMRQIVLDALASG